MNLRRFWNVFFFGLELAFYSSTSLLIYVVFISLTSQKELLLIPSHQHSFSYQHTHTLSHRTGSTTIIVHQLPHILRVGGGETATFHLCESRFSVTVVTPNQTCKNFQAQDSTHIYLQNTRKLMSYGDVSDSVTLYGHPNRPQVSLIV